MKMFNLFSCIIILFLLGNVGAYAQQEAVASVATVPKSETPTTPEEEVKPEEKPKVTLSGYIDTYYLHAFNNPKSGTLMGSPSINGGFPVGRAFDRMDNQFSLGLVQTKFTYSDKKSDLVIDLTFGPNAEMGNFGNSTGSTNLWRSGDNYVSQLYGTSAAIKQAYFTYKPTEKLSFTVGQFGTHIGYEVIDAPVNYNYSLSNLFNNGPFYHIGLKVNYALNSKLSLMAGLVNNWDNLFDNNKQKSLIGQLYFKPVEGFNIYLNYIGGHGDDTYLTTVANATSAPYLEKYNRHLFDLTAGYQITSKFYLGVNAAYGFYDFKPATAEKQSIVDLYGSTKPSWGGVAIYSNFAVNDAFGIGVRYEMFEDKKYVRYIGTKNNSLTITTPITLADAHLIIKPELRLDAAAKAYYENKDGNAVKNQSSIGVAFIYKY
jgi:Putative beta-barrel porin-2, OmpL-like. bbp2